MHYTTHTPLSLDRVLDVIGKDRFVAQFHLPVDQWDLTPVEIARLATTAHKALGVYLVDSDYMGIEFSEFIVECECGEKFTARLLSQAQAQHDAHSGYVAESHVHTAQLLEG